MLRASRIKARWTSMSSGGDAIEKLGGRAGRCDWIGLGDGDHSTAGGSAHGGRLKDATGGFVLFALGGRKMRIGWLCVCAAAGQQVTEVTKKRGRPAPAGAPNQASSFLVAPPELAETPGQDVGSLRPFRLGPVFLQHQRRLGNRNSSSFSRPHLRSPPAAHCYRPCFFSLWLCVAR
jgi:hypothetical protein